MNVGYESWGDIVGEVKEGLALLDKYGGSMPVSKWLEIHPSEEGLPDVTNLTISADAKRLYIHNEKFEPKQWGVAWDHKWGLDPKAYIRSAIDNMQDFTSADQFDTDTDSDNDDDSDSDADLALSDYLAKRFPGMKCNINTKGLMIHVIGDGFALLFKEMARVPVVKIYVGYESWEDIVGEAAGFLPWLDKYNSAMPVSDYLAIHPSEDVPPDVSDLTISADAKRIYIHDEKAEQCVAWDHKWRGARKADIPRAMKHMQPFTSANQFDTDLDISSDEDSDSEAEMPARPSKRPTNEPLDEALAAKAAAAAADAARSPTDVLKNMPHTKLLEIVHKERVGLADLSVRFDELCEMYGGNMGVDKQWLNWMEQLSTDKWPSAGEAEQER